ncbi:unnamed protein product [Cutaneotrichosporon oleaginosum]
MPCKKLPRWREQREREIAAEEDDADAASPTPTPTAPPAPPAVRSTSTSTATTFTLADTFRMTSDAARQQVMEHNARFFGTAPLPPQPPLPPPIDLHTSSASRTFYTQSTQASDFFASQMYHYPRYGTYGAL